MKPREVRRDRTIRIGERRRKRHLERVHPDGVVDCVCEFSPWKFAKSAGLGCNCRGRRHGSPKTGVGMCTGGAYAYRLAVQERISGKRLCRQWRISLRTEFDPEDAPHAESSRVWT